MATAGICSQQGCLLLLQSFQGMIPDQAQAHCNLELCPTEVPVIDPRLFSVRQWRAC